MNRAAHFGWYAVAALWGWGLCCGLPLLHVYSLTPGDPAAKPETAAMIPPADQPRVMMFAHPRCPCTAASLEELARIAARFGDRATMEVWFYRPADADAAWTDGKNCRAAAEIPGVRVYWDIDGDVGRRFGASTSGHVVMFNRSGQQCFHGGITPARGHNGINEGRRSIERYLAGGSDGQPMEAFPVFGCSLRGNSVETSARGDQP